MTDIPPPPGSSENPAGETTPPPPVTTPAPVSYGTTGYPGVRYGRARSGRVRRKR